MKSPRSRTEPRRRRQAESLLEELLATREEKRSELLQEGRFQSWALVELLVEAGQAALPFDPRAAREPLSLAIHLTEVIRAQGELDAGKGVRQGLSRAFCLAATVHRLLGEELEAEAALKRARWCLASAADRGWYCRTRGLLRWDQGRTEKASALLRRAVLRFDQAEDQQEHLACFVLLGLLHLLDGEIAEAARYFERASLDPEYCGRPWLAAQACLGWACCLAAAGESKQAEEVRTAARRFREDVQDEEMRLCLDWLEGWAAVLAGKSAEGEDLLDSVRRRMIERRRLAEATLATIDLSVARIGAGQPGETDALSEELRAAFARSPGLDFALEAVSKAAAEVVGGLLDHDGWKRVAPNLRLAFRCYGLRLRPVPFA